MPEDGQAIMIPGEDPRGVREQEPLWPEVAAYREQAARFGELRRGEDQASVEAEDHSPYSQSPPSRQARSIRRSPAGRTPTGAAQTRSPASATPWSGLMTPTRPLARAKPMRPSASTITGGLGLSSVGPKKLIAPVPGTPPTTPPVPPAKGAV